jgi:hypothetical protein
MRTRSYSDLSQLEQFLDRFEYLSLGGFIGTVTFGFDRWINQKFYRSPQWHQVRNFVIARDGGNDLGVRGYEIHHALLVHHMNPIASSDIVHGEDWILDPEFLITTSHRTHNAIHYGDQTLLPKPWEPRRPGDTRLW